jgi:hypothetical protein
MVHKLKSNSIEHIDKHDKDVLEIKFSSGAVYHYKDCANDHFEGLKNAESAGKYFKQFILNKYDHEKR